MNKANIIENIIANLNGITNNLEALKKVLNESAVSEALKETKEQETSKADTQEVSEEKQPTLEEIRASMAQKNKEGHRKEIKEILLKFGANKLTSLDPKYYVEVLKEVGEIK